MFPGVFAQDVNSTEANIMAVVQKPFSTSMLALMIPKAIGNIDTPTPCITLAISKTVKLMDMAATEMPIA
jgi:hypothetical protein